MNILKPVILLSVFLIVSCASQKSVRKEIATMEKGPSEVPRKIITNFSHGLRCMDNTLIEYGIRDVSMLVEDLADKTSSVKAGTKDMLITAVSNMTRRSRAVKLIPFGNDSGNLIAFLGNAGSESPYNIIPQYDIRGSISQLDKSVVSKQAGVSIAVDDFSTGGSKSLAGSILGLDLSVLTTDDLSVIPGVTSSNSVVLFKSGSGGDADATIKKTGISFDFSVKKSEAVVQALRNLIELASIELIGKLVKVPYWRCLGIPETSDEIKQEIEDWYYAMNAHGELIPYIRSLLIARNFYPSIVLNESDAFNIGLNSFQRSVGLSETNQINYEVFYALLNGNLPNAENNTLENQSNNALASSVSNNTNVAAVQAAPTAPTALTQQPLATQSIALSIVATNGQRYFKRGEAIALTAKSNQSAYVYCYLKDSNNNIQRFFPNRFQKNNFIAAGSEISLPGNMPFDIVANEQGYTEYVSCFATHKNSYSALPDSLKVYDFETIPQISITDLRSGFQSSVNGQVAEARFVIESR